MHGEWSPRSASRKRKRTDLCSSSCHLKQQHWQRQGQGKQGAPTERLHRPFWWGQRLLCALLSAVTASNGPPLQLCHCDTGAVSETPDTAQYQNQRKKKVSQKTVEGCQCPVFVITLSPFWRPEVQNRAIGKAVLSPESPGAHPSLPLRAPAGFQGSSAYRCIAPISASLITCHPPYVCLSVSTFPGSSKDTSHWTRAHSNPV